jgi:type III secretory pathway component EscR
MTITINNHLIVILIFYFFLSAFLSYLFKQANIFLKLVVFFFIIGFFVSIESANRLDVTIASILGFLFIYADTALDFLFGIKLGIETVVFGFFDMIRRVLRFIFTPIANCFTWFYNLLSRFFGWNLKFHRLGEPRPKDGNKDNSHRSYRKPRQHWQHGSSRHKADNRDQDLKSGQTRHRSYKPRDDGSATRSSQGDKSQTTSTKYTSSADKQKQDSINRAKEEVRQAREQNKRKEQQRQGNTDEDSTQATAKSSVSGDKRSHQQILGLSDNFTLAELTKAYKMGLARYHPDKYSHMSADFQKEAQAEFIKIKNSFNFLIKDFN